MASQSSSTSSTKTPPATTCSSSSSTRCAPAPSCSGATRPAFASSTSGSTLVSSPCRKFPRAPRASCSTRARSPRCSTASPTRLRRRRPAKTSPAPPRRSPASASTKIARNCRRETAIISYVIQPLLDEVKRLERENAELKAARDAALADVAQLKKLYDALCHEYAKLRRKVLGPTREHLPSNEAQQSLFEILDVLGRLKGGDASAQANAEALLDRL